MLGALIGSLIILALEWMAADILATPASVERATGLPVLGAIPAAAGEPQDMAKSATQPCVQAKYQEAPR